MTANPDVPKPSQPAKAEHLVFWDPCSGAEPVIVEDPRAFLTGRLIVLALAVAVLGLLVLLVALLKESS